MTTKPPLRAAVIGVGHLGRFHARVYSELPDVELRYVVDIDPVRAASAAQQYGGEPLTDHREILDDVDIASVVTPTHTHHPIARDLLDAGASILLEKPMTMTVWEADDLIQIARNRKAALQIGHIERFNPAYRAARDLIREPIFIECHRLTSYAFRGTDVSVVLDLMIHDLDLILDFVFHYPPPSIEAVGVAVLSGNTDLANARLHFPGPGGRTECIANLTASRVSPSPMRRLRVFQRDLYVSMDFLQKKVYVFRKKDGIDPARLDPQQLANLSGLSGDLALGQLMDIREMSVAGTDALKDELSAFVAAVRNGSPPPVTGEHGRRALATAVEIDREIQRFLTARFGEQGPGPARGERE